MAYSEDHIALAAEYALGTLDADERTQVETMMAVDPDFAAVVQAWEFRLGSLNQMVGSVEPRPIVWENIRAAIGLSGEPLAPPMLPDADASLAPEPPSSATSSSPPPSPATQVEPADVRPIFAEIRQRPAAPAPAESNVIDLASRVRRWRSIASVASAIAA